MLNRKPDPQRRSVWVLMFESLSLEFVCRDSTLINEGKPEDNSETVENNPTGDEAATILKRAYTSFDDLDIGSSFFEQYLIQDARGGVKVAEIFGGEEALVHFRQLLRNSFDKMVA